MEISLIPGIGLDLHDMRTTQSLYESFPQVVKETNITQIRQHILHYYDCSNNYERQLYQVFEAYDRDI